MTDTQPQDTVTINSALADSAFCNWLAGFTDGEGTFAVGDRFRYQLKQRCDDLKLIRQIKEKLQVGRIYSNDNSQARAVGVNRQDMVFLEVYNELDLANVIIPLFDKYPLRGKKKRVYDAWKQYFNLHRSESSSKVRKSIRMQAKEHLKLIRHPNSDSKQDNLREV